MSVQTPMVGSWTVEILGVRPFSIHGDMYFELHCRRIDAPQDVLALRVPEHAFSGIKPEQGQRWQLAFLMGQVTTATREPIADDPQRGA